MTKDSPTPLGGGRSSPKKPSSPGPAAAVLEEQRRDLEKLRAELEAERARGRAEQRRFAAQARQLRESAERERQQLADHLRSKWEAQRFRELRQLQEEMQREREAEIRQLLRWKEAELRQLQQLLHQERDGVVRQARELQRQLAQELMNRGYCGRTGPSEVSAAQCRCRLQEVLAQLRWENDSEQAARIRHLQAALNMERQLFLKYILEHFRWQPGLPGPADCQISHSSEELTPETRTPKPACSLGSLENLSSEVRVRSRSLDLVPTACSSSPDNLLPTRSNSFNSLATAHSCSLDSTLSCPKTSKTEVQASTTNAPIPETLNPPPPLLPSTHRKPNDPRGNECSRNQPGKSLTPSPPGLDYQELVRQNSELNEALQVLARRYYDLREENAQLRRACLANHAAEKEKWLKGKRAELTGLAQRLEDRVRKLQDTNLRAVSAPGPGEKPSGLELYQAFARQRAQDLAEQAGALLAKDQQIDELRRECHLLQTRIATDLGSSSQPGEGAPCAQWFNISDLERLQRESQKEVLRLQRQLTLQQCKGGAREENSWSAPFEEARHQVQALERQLGQQQRECEELSAQAAAAQRRSQEAEIQLQTELHKGVWLAKENARLQALADRVRKMADEKEDVPQQLSRATQRQELEDTSLLAEQLLQQEVCGQDWQQQLKVYANETLGDLQAAKTELQGLQSQLSHHPPQPQISQAPESQVRVTKKSKLKLKEEHILSLPSRNIESPASLSMQESPVAPSVPQVSDRSPVSQPLDSRPQAEKISSQSNSSSEVESVWATVPSCFSVDMDTASEVEDLEPDSVSTPPEVRVSEDPTTPKLKLFLARCNYNPFEGSSEHPEGELPLRAGDYVYIFGDMDENGFYKGELVNGQRGLVPCHLVEQISGSTILSCLLPKSPERPTTLLAGQSKALKKDGLLFSEALESVERRPCQMGRSDAKIDSAVEILETKTEACHLGSGSSEEEQSFCRSLLEAKGVFCVAPMQLQLQSITATSAEITWACGSSRYPHVVYLEDQEHTVTPSGVSCYTFQGLHPGTHYRVRVGVQLPRDLLQMLWKMMSSTLTFDTPLAGPPEPPLDVLVEHHVLPGFLVVSWLPVTIDSAGSSNGVQVTGYAIYVDGLKVAEVADATAGNTVLEFSQLQVPLACQKVSVRTMSLYGESLDSVPAQIPEDCFSCHPFVETPPCSHTNSDPSSFRTTFPFCHQELVQASLTTKVGTHTPGNCGEPQDKFLEAFLEEPLRKQTSLSNLNSEVAGNQVQESKEARKACGKGLLFQKNPQKYTLPLSTCQSGMKEVHSQHMCTSRSPSPGFILLSPEYGPGKVPCPEKALKPKRDTQMFAPHQQGSSQHSAANLHCILEEKTALCLDSQCTEKSEQKRKFKSQSGQRQVPGDKRECQSNETSSASYPTPASKVIKTYSGGSRQLETEANTPVRVFVALSDYSPVVTSVNNKAAEEELAFQKGQLLKVWGSQDPCGFYHGECNGQVGKIPGHLVVEVEVGTEQTGGRLHLLAQGHLYSEAHSEDVEGLTNPQTPFFRPHGNTRTPTLRTPKTMIAALDYNPRDEKAGVQAKGKLALRAGDVVTVFGPMDDKGFYYGEYGGHRGLVPAHLLDDLSVHGE